MNAESRLRGLLAGLLCFLATTGLVTWTQSRPGLAIQFVQLAHAAAGLVVIVLGVTYVAVHLAQTLAAPERPGRKPTRTPWLAVRSLFGGTWLAPDRPFQAKKLAALLVVVGLAIAYLMTHGPYTAGAVRAFVIGGGIVTVLAAVRIVGLGRAPALAIGIAGVLLVFVLIAIATGSNAPRVLLIGVIVAGFVSWAVARSTGTVTRTPGGLGALAMLACFVAAIGGAGTALGLMLYTRVPGLEKLPIPWFVHVTASGIAVALVLAHVRSSRNRSARLANPAKRAYPWAVPLRRVAVPTFAVAAIGTIALAIVGSARVEPFASDETSLVPMGAGFSEVLPAACDTCHVDVVYGWARSSHARAADNPLFTALLRRLHDERGPEEARICLRCHAPHARDPVGASFDEVVGSEGYRAGVHCVSCHRTTPDGEADGALAAKPFGGGEFALLTERPGLGRRIDFAPGARRFVENSLVSSRLERHRERYRFAIHEANSCRPCHVQTLGPSTGGRMHDALQDQYASWRTSPAAEAGIACNTCHMTHYQRAYGTPVHDHRFLAASTYVAAVSRGEEGVNEVVAALSGQTPLPPAGREPFDEAALARQRPPQSTPGPLLVMEAELAPDALVIRTRNSGQIGHDFPSGPTDLFQIWLSARVTDAGGRVALDVGSNGPDGAPQLGHRLRDADGELIQDHRLHAVHEVVEIGRVPVTGHHEVRLDRTALACEPTSESCSFHLEAAWNYRRLDAALVERITGSAGPELPIVRVGSVTTDLAVARP